MAALRPVLPDAYQRRHALGAGRIHRHARAVRRRSRILAAVDFKDGKVVRRIDYWDSSFGAETATKMQTPANKFPTNFDYDVASESTSAKIRGVAQKLAAAFAAGDAKAADELFSNDAVYLDRALRVRILGKLGKYLSRVLPTMPCGSGAKQFTVETRPLSSCTSHARNRAGDEKPLSAAPDAAERTVAVDHRLPSSIDAHMLRAPAIGGIAIERAERRVGDGFFAESARAGRRRHFRRRSTRKTSHRADHRRHQHDLRRRNHAHITSPVLSARELF